MLQRSALPALDASEDTTMERVLQHLQAWRRDTAATRETLAGLRQRVDEVSRQLESPKAALDYVDFFTDMFERMLADLDAVLAALPGGFQPSHGDTLRQLASNAAVEQRRTVMFRDKWVNKPLPYEQVRPLLTQLASDVRDQLADYRDLTPAATRLAALSASPPPPEAKPEGLGRRELFSRLIRPPEDIPPTDE